MSTKNDVIQDAYSRIRISGITIDPSANDVSTALDRLESMMSELSFCVGYNFEETPDLNSLTKVDRKYRGMMQANLAIRLIPDFNKEVPPILYSLASALLSSASSKVAAENIRQVQPSSRMPVGSGRRSRYQHFEKPASLPSHDCAGHAMSLNEVNDYTESFTSYLDPEEVVSSFTVTAETGLNGCI